MKPMTRTENGQSRIADNKGFAVETTFVLFFLAVEFGQSADGFAFDSMFLSLTLVMFAVLPYLLYSKNEKPNFSKWIFGRSLIAAFAILLGAMFKQSLGVVLPETFRFLPLTLLVATAMICCYIQFYGFIKLRPAK
jgi:Na+-translocating ferredoxin:NAD+ oxidoreductase RnfA subunit